MLDHAFVARGLPAHAVADHAVALLPARVADEALALGRFDDVVAAVAGHNQSDVERDGLAQRQAAAGVVIGIGLRQAVNEINASARAAQMKSLIEMPFTECVLKRTTQRL